VSLKLNEILESGLLELYVLGQLTEEEIKSVEDAKLKFPELKHEIFAIEKAIFHYDQQFKLTPPSGVLESINQQLGFNNSTPAVPEKASKSSAWSIASLILGLGLIGSLFYAWNLKKQSSEIQLEQNALLQKCEEEKNIYNENQRMMASALDLNASKYLIAPTDKYPDTELVIYNNPTTKKNFIQISNLPPLANNQSYQLWSLKGTNAPIPLDVFESQDQEFIEVSFVDDTNAYAITIEPRGGQDSPTMENLIGVFSIEG